MQVNISNTVFFLPVTYLKSKEILLQHVLDFFYFYPYVVKKKKKKVKEKKEKSFSFKKWTDRKRTVFTRLFSGIPAYSTSFPQHSSIRKKLTKTHNRHRVSIHLSFTQKKDYLKTQEKSLCNNSQKYINKSKKSIPGPEIHASPRLEGRFHCIAYYFTISSISISFYFHFMLCLT